jgi:hypothetical protein
MTPKPRPPRHLEDILGVEDVILDGGEYVGENDTNASNEIEATRKRGRPRLYRREDFDRGLDWYGKEGHALLPLETVHRVLEAFLKPRTVPALKTLENWLRERNSEF